MKLYSEIKARIDENKSFLKMAELHMDERATTVINQRIFQLERELDVLPEPAMEVEDKKKIYSCKECGVFVFTADGRHCINGHLYFPPIPDSK